MRFVVQPGGTLRGQLSVPGDKSVSHRSVMLGAIAEGVTEVSGFLEGEDALATLAAFQAMGVQIDRPEPGRLVIHGVGKEGLKAPAGPLDLGNSGTSMRLLAGLLAGQRFDSELLGDPSLSRRPMRRVMDPLAEMGAHIDSTPGGTAPLQIHGGALSAIDYRLPMASAQVKSCLLLAGLYAEGETRVEEPAVTRDHTERMLEAFGYPIERAGRKISLSGGGSLRAAPIRVPADLSSAAFFLVGASLAAGSELSLPGVGVNPTRSGVLDILGMMGAQIQLDKLDSAGAEPIADLRVRAAELSGVEIPASLVPLSIDELPAVMVAAACAEGETLLSGAEELRVKESDRISTMKKALSALGAEVEERPDGMRLVGQASLRGGVVDAAGDHRIAMSMAMAALRAEAPVIIEDADAVATSFPGFVELARSVGLQISAEG